MTAGGPAVSATPPAAAYETLRAAVLNGQPQGQRGLAVIVHRGLATWIGELSSKALPETVPSPTFSPRTPPADPVSAPNELTRVLAEIILALTAGEATAHA